MEKSSPARARGGPRALCAGLLAGLALLAALLVTVAATRAVAQEPPVPPVLDPDNGDYAKLQKPAEAFAGLPRDPRGRVDWMRALREGLIQPRADVAGKQPMQVLKLDIVMRNTAEMPHVKFPHESHTLWLECSNCHDGIFVAKAGANPITMTKIFRGEYCGVCHDRVAFTTLFACERCHSVLQPGTQAWWTEVTSGRPAGAPAEAAAAASSAASSADAAAPRRVAPGTFQPASGTRR